MASIENSILVAMMPDPLRAALMREGSLEPVIHRVIHRGLALNDSEEELVTSSMEQLAKHASLTLIAAMMPLAQEHMADMGALDRAIVMEWLRCARSA
jgi:hypothetical protein